MRQALNGLSLLVAVLLVLGLGIWANLPRASQSGASAAATTVVEASLSFGATPNAASPGESEAAGPSPSGLFVEPVVVDRPGVPAAVSGKYWIAYGQAGQVGTTARIVLPSNEAILGVDDGRVATMLYDHDAHQPIVGPDGLTIVVREFLSGATVRTFNTPVHVTESVMAGSLLFWIGQVAASGGLKASDAGVWAINLADPASTPQAIIGPADLSATYGTRATRGLLRVTDRGRAITTEIESDTVLVTDVIEVASLSLRATIDADRQYAFAVVGGLAFVIVPHEYTSQDRPGVIRLIDIASGRQIGPETTADLLKGSVVGDREMFVQIGRGADSFILGIDLGSGESRDIRVVRGGREIYDLSSQLSAPNLLVLVPVTGPEVDERGLVLLPITLLDPATGVLNADAFTIGAP